MKNTVSIVCALVALSACGERGATGTTGDKPATDAAQVQADMQAAHEAAGAGIEQARRERADADAERGADGRLAQYKAALLPLIAGQYAGACSTRTDDVDGAIRIGADGSVSAPGMKTGSVMTPASQLSFSTESVGGAPVRLGFVARDDAEDVQVSTSSAGGELSTTYTNRDEAIKCVQSRPARRDRMPTAYPALARFFVGGARTMRCKADTAAPGSYRVTPTANGVSIAGDTYLLRWENATEIAVVDARDAALSYAMEMADGARISMKLDRAGRLHSFSLAGDRSSKAYSCEPEQG